MKRRQYNDEERKEQIRSAAKRCFVRKGYEATRLHEIAREAGLSKGGIYFHYPAKEQLFHDILDDLSRSLHERWTFETFGDQPVDRVLGSLVAAHLRTMQSEPEEVRLYNLLIVMAAQDTLFREKLEEVVHIMRNLYAKVIAQGIGEGVFAAGEPNTLAISVLAFINGLGGFTVLDAAGRLPITPEDAAEQILRMLRARRSASVVEFGGERIKPPSN